MKNQLPMLSYFFLFRLFLLISIALTVTICYSVLFFNLRDGPINPTTFGAALTSRCAGVFGSSMTLSCSISDSSCASQSSSLILQFAMSPFQESQFSVSEKLSGVLFSSLSARCRAIFYIRCTFNIWVCHPRMFFADHTGGWGDLSHDLNTAEQLCWTFDQDALTISSVSEMYPMAVICSFWACDSFWVAWRFWLPCHISKRSWTLAILCNFHSTASLSSSVSFSALVGYNTRSLPANIPLLARAYCLTTTFSHRVSPVLFHCLHLIMSRPREKLASTPTQYAMIEYMLHATLVKSAYCERVSPCWCYQSMISGNQNVQLISMGSEW